MTIARRPTQSRELVRISDRVSFLYLEHCKINRESNALTVTDKRGIAHIPAATIGALLLGPGTTVTQQAMLLLSDSGSSAVWVGERGVRYYAHGNPLARSSRLLEAQAAAVTNRRARLRVARAMYEMRFPGENVDRLTMQQLRGREGARVRQIYREQSQRTGVEWQRRLYDPERWEDADPINQALSAANAALYGVIHSVIVALGCSPALGFVHTGHYRSFVYDIADLYKSEISIPISFDIVAETTTNIAARARSGIRDQILDGKLLERSARDIQTLILGGSTLLQDESLDADVISLWDERGPSVAGGILYDAPR